MTLGSCYVLHLCQNLQAPCKLEWHVWLLLSSIVSTEVAECTCIMDELWPAITPLTSVPGGCWGGGAGALLFDVGCKKGSVR